MVEVITYRDFDPPRFGIYAQHVDRLILCQGGHIIAVGPRGVVLPRLDEGGPAIDPDSYYDAHHAPTHHLTVVGEILFSDLEVSR